MARVARRDRAPKTPLHIEGQRFVHEQGGVVTLRGAHAPELPYPPVGAAQRGRAALARGRHVRPNRVARVSLSLRQAPERGDTQLWVAADAAFGGAVRVEIEPNNRHWRSSGDALYLACASHAARDQTQRVEACSSAAAPYRTPSP